MSVAFAGMTSTEWNLPCMALGTSTIMIWQTVWRKKTNKLNKPVFFLGVQSKLEQCIEKKYSQKFWSWKMSTNNVKKTKTSEIIRIDPFKIKKETNRKKQNKKETH